MYVQNHRQTQLLTYYIQTQKHIQTYLQTEKARFSIMALGFIIFWVDKMVELSRRYSSISKRYLQFLEGIYKMFKTPDCCLPSSIPGKRLFRLPVEEGPGAHTQAEQLEAQRDQLTVTANTAPQLRIPGKIDRQIYLY